MVNSITTPGSNSGITSMMKSLAKTPKASLSDYMDPEKQKEADKVKANLQQALTALKDAPNQAAKQRKAVAAQKVALIKQQLETLKKTPGMDPKAMARMAAMLAKQLAAALKDYAAAGATTSEMQSASASTSGGSSPATPAASDEAAASNEAQSEVQVNPGTDTTPKASEAAPGKQPQPQDVKSMFQTGTEKDKSGDTRTTRVKDDDSQFIKDAKKILEDLKNLLKIQKIRLQGAPDEDSYLGKKATKSINEGEKALAEAEKSIRQIGFQTVSSGPTFSILA